MLINKYLMLLLAIITVGALLPRISLAEKVEVKYVGPVELAAYKCTETISSFVNRICYNEPEKNIVVLLKSTYYAYCEVNLKLATDWIDSDSKGAFYNSYVKGRFDCRDQ